METEQVFDNQKSLLIKNARLFDGTGRPPQESQCIRIMDGEIVGIGPELPGNGLRELDLDGATVMPGLIDACVNLKNVPGAVYRQDSEDQLRKLRFQHLRGYLACGVTTVLDNSIPAPLLREFHEYLDSGGPGPRLYALAPEFSAMDAEQNDRKAATDGLGPNNDGHEGEIKASFAEFEGIKNIVGVRVVLINKMPGGIKWHPLSGEILDAILQESLKRNLPIYAMATTKHTISIGLEMGVHEISEIHFPHDKPDNDILAKIKNSGTYIATCLSAFTEGLPEVILKERIIGDNLLKLAVPEEELETAMSRKAWNDMMILFLKKSQFKWVPAFILKGLRGLFFSTSAIRSVFINARQAIMAMYNMGIPLVVGSESSSGPIIPASFHGPTTIREIEMLGVAGMRPMDVLLSATKVPAEMMGLADLIGTVEKGKRADLIVMRDDPLSDLGALRNLTWVIKDGQARTPAGWMREAA